MNLSTLKTGLIFESLFTSFVVSILAALAATYFAIRTDLLDRPNSEPHKQHKHPVPVSGGIALLATMLVVFPFFVSIVFTLSLVSISTLLSSKYSTRIR